MHICTFNQLKHAKCF